MNPPFRSDKVLNHAKGQPCTLRLPTICRSDQDVGHETTVAAHISDRHKGGAIKASDHSIVFACFWCHSYMDETHGRRQAINDVTLQWCIIKGLQQTWEVLIEDGIIGFPHNQPKAKTVKPRKPKSERTPIRSGKKQWPKRSFPKRSKQA